MFRNLVLTPRGLKIVPLYLRHMYLSLAGLGIRISVRYEHMLNISAGFELSRLIIVKIYEYREFAFRGFDKVAIFSIHRYLYFVIFRDHFQFR
jgi:hypothetical protein